jgi:hypothetical protein
MKQNRVISIAVLFLLLGAAIPAFAQKGEEEKPGGGEKAQPAQHQAQPQHEQKAQPEQRAQKAQPQQGAQKAQPEQRAQKAQPQQGAQKAQPEQRAEKAQPQQRAQKAQPQRAQQAKQSGGQQPQAVASKSGASHYGRISDASYRSHFGRGHSFHMGHPQMIEGYNRFQYGGYWFGFNEGWPVGWDYNDDFYVEYIDGVYYMFNLRHPGFRLTLNIF